MKHLRSSLMVIATMMICTLAIAQETAEEWIQAAETAEAEGRLTDAGSAYSAAGQQLLKDGDPEGAAEQFIKAAEKFAQDGRTAQSGQERVNAATAYEQAADKASEDGDHKSAADLYDKAAEQYDANDLEAMADGARRKAENERAYPISTNLTATGNSNGNVAVAHVINNKNQTQSVTIPSGTIASDGKSQGFVVPEPIVVSVPPNSTTTVSITGYCINPGLPAPKKGIPLGAPQDIPAYRDLLTTSRNIITQTRELVDGGDVSTPFDPAKGKQVLIQYSIWTALPDQPLSLTDLCEHINHDYETFTGSPISALSLSDRPAFDHGVLQILDGVGQIGKGAGVPQFTTPPLPVVPVKDAMLPSNSDIARTVKVTATGAITDHVGDLFISNPTSRPVAVKIGDGRSYMPNNDKQPFILDPIPLILLDPHQNKTIPLNGICAHVGIPPEAQGKDLSRPSEWIGSGTSAGSPVFPDNYDPVTIPTRIAPSINEVTGLLRQHETSSGSPGDPCPDGPLSPTPYIPGTEFIIRDAITPSTNPGVAVPLLLDALDKIIHEYDVRKASGKVHTPFSGNDEKERSAHLQQAFWKYSSALYHYKYGKKDFRATTLREFEKATGKKFEDIPEQDQEKLDSGVDDFWNSFTAVVKPVMADPEIPEPSPAVEDDWGSFEPEHLKEPDHGSEVPGTMTEPGKVPGTPGNEPELISNTRPGKYCECDSISFDLQVFDAEATGRNSWRSKPGTQPITKPIKVSSTAGEPDYVVELEKKNLKNGDIQLVTLKNVDYGCNCLNITREVINAIKELDRLERGDGAKLAKAKDDLAEAEKDLTDARNARRPSQTKIDRLEKEIAGLKDKINELEPPLLAKRKEVEDMKKAARVSYCGVYGDKSKEEITPTVKVTANGAAITPKLGSEGLEIDYTFKCDRGRDPLECTITISFYCVDDDCQETSCQRTIKVKFE